MIVIDQGRWIGAAIAGAMLSRCCFGVMAPVGTGAGGTIPRSNVLGPGAFQSSVFVSDPRSVSDVSVLLTNLLHAWMGELSAWVTHVPSGRSAMLFDRVGSSAGNPAGDSSDFVGRYTFVDGGASLSAVAAATGATAPIPTGSYAASGAAGVSVSLASVFGGVAASGEWRVSIRNHGQSDEGLLGSWTLGLDLDSPPPVIVPLGSGGLLCGAGLLLAGARRRR